MSISLGAASTASDISVPVMLTPGVMVMPGWPCSFCCRSDPTLQMSSMVVVNGQRMGLAVLMEVALLLPLLLHSDAVLIHLLGPLRCVVM